MFSIPIPTFPLFSFQRRALAPHALRFSRDFSSFPTISSHESTNRVRSSRHYLHFVVRIKSLQDDRYLRIIVLFYMSSFICSLLYLTFSPFVRKPVSIWILMCIACVMKQFEIRETVFFS